MRKRNIKLPGKQCWAAKKPCGPKVRIGNTLCIMIKVDQLNAIFGNNPNISYGYGKDK